MSIFTKNSKISKQKAIIMIIFAAIVMAATVLIRASPGCGFGAAELLELSSTEGRQKYLAEYGWETDAGSEERRTILIPRELNGAIAQYAELQTEQGYDFASCCGLECTQYTYTVTNYPYESTVYAVLYVKNGRAIGGDIHSADINGFMHGIR